MKPDQKRVSALLVQTVSLLCKNGLHFEKGLRIQGLLGITIDDKDVFLVQIDDKLLQKVPSEGQQNISKRKSKSDHEPLIRNTYKDLSNQVLDVGMIKLSKCLDPPILDESHDEMNTDDRSIENMDSSKAIGTDDEIIFVKSEVDDLIVNEEDHNMAIVSKANDGEKTFTDQIGGIESLNEDEDDYVNENYSLVHANQRRSFPQVNDFLMQQQFTNGSSLETSPTIFEGRCSTFKDQSASFDETFHHLSGAQEMIKESWTFTKYKQMTRHSNNNQMVSSGATNALIYSKSQSSNSDKSGHVFGTSEELLPASSPRRRSSIKTVVCQYPECGKTFCHSCHLYRHQRLKHGRRFGVVSQASFACQFPDCGKVFYRKASLINHNFAVHNMGPRPPPSPEIVEEDNINISF